MGKGLIALVWAGVLAFACGKLNDSPTGGGADVVPAGGEGTEGGAGGRASSSYAGSNDAGAGAGHADRSTGGGAGAGGNPDGPEGAGGEGGAGGSPCLCADVTCPADYVEVSDGCCSHCEVKPEVCRKQHADYEVARLELFKQFAADSCQVSDDCHEYVNPPACGVFDCDPLIAGPRVDEFQKALNAYAEASCNPDCPTDFGGEGGAGQFECEPTTHGCWSHRCIAD